MVDFTKPENCIQKISTLVNYSDSKGYSEIVDAVFKNKIHGSLIKYSAMHDFAKRSENNKNRVLKNVIDLDKVTFTNVQVNGIKASIFKIKDVSEFIKLDNFNEIMKSNLINEKFAVKIYGHYFEKKGTVEEKEYDKEMMKKSVEYIIEKQLLSWLTENKDMSFIKDKGLEDEFNIILKKKLPGFYKAIQIVNEVENKKRPRRKMAP
jgi:hypothetical protein